jgi:hypothetical protein
MRSILLSVIWLLFPFVMVGCAGWVVPQQSRLEIPESAGFFIVHPQGLFFTPMALTLKEGMDGVVSVHAADGAASVHLFSDPVSGPELAQLNSALLPFLFPSCDVPLSGMAPR